MTDPFKDDSSETLQMATGSYLDVDPLSVKIGDPPFWGVFRFPLHQPEKGTLKTKHCLRIPSASCFLDGLYFNGQWLSRSGFG